MAKITFLKPIDQPLGKNRLIDELKTCFSDPSFNHVLIIVAFAKAGVLIRLKEFIENWRLRGKTINSIFGIDHHNTSLQALEFAMDNFDESHVFYVENPRVTFHPKFYLFYGEKKSICIYGSHNLTVGGTETNFEGGVKIELDLPDDVSIFNEAMTNWSDIQPLATKLNYKLIDYLIKRGLIVDETASTRVRAIKQSENDENNTDEYVFNFNNLTLKPPSPMPRSVLRPTKTRKIRPEIDDSTNEQVFAEEFVNSNDLVQDIVVEALIIQIIPHHNGEVFLSKTAIDQKPEFFGFPFSGLTIPKKNVNKAYPQREPDPIVNIWVFDTSDRVVYYIEKYNLNTVYYDTKSEIRITVPQDVVRNCPEYSILVMGKSNDTTCNYDMQIYVPGSNQYDAYLNNCDQTMPTGGKSIPRRFGWI